MNVTLTTNFASNSSGCGRPNFQRAPASGQLGSIERGSLAESDTGTVFDLLHVWIRLSDPGPPKRGRLFKNGPQTRVHQQSYVLVAQSCDVDYRWGVEFGPPRLPYPSEHKCGRGLAFAWQVLTITPKFPPPHRRGKITTWAYSSIGQSPRLITGLFLVRTQVGPLREVGGGYWMVRSPWTRDDRSTN